MCHFKFANFHICYLSQTISEEMVTLCISDAIIQKLCMFSIVFNNLFKGQAISAGVSAPRQLIQGLQGRLLCILAENFMLLLMNIPITQKLCKVCSVCMHTCIRYTYIYICIETIHNFSMIRQFEFGKTFSGTEQLSTFCQ